MVEKKIILLFGAQQLRIPGLQVFDCFLQREFPCLQFNEHEAQRFQEPGLLLVAMLAIQRAIHLLWPGVIPPSDGRNHRVKTFQQPFVHNQFLASNFGHPQQSSMALDDGNRPQLKYFQNRLP